MLKNNQTEYLYTIRFSNFGKLATINGIENLNTKNLEIIKTELKNYDFIFLEPNEIDFDYDGKFEIAASVNDILEISYFGLLAGMEIKITDQSYYEIFLGEYIPKKTKKQLRLEKRELKRKGFIKYED